ncbi:MAG: EAL domain-containing protein [Chloroflexota bacterium]|nr:EAL domain-containing protein [Chloroflexota bacterium]
MWGVTVALAAGAVLVYVFGVRPLSLMPGIAGLEWWILVIGFAGAEILVVHLQFRRDTHSFSLSEIPLVIGLFFVRPDLMLLAQLVGAGAALVLHRRQPLIKLAFNLSNLTFGTGVAIVLFRAILGDGDPLGPVSWAAGFSAAIAADALGLAMIAVVISLSAGQPPELRRLFASGMIATFCNTSLALVAVTVVWRNPDTTWLLAVLAAMLFVAYRGYAALRQKHEGLELMYESTRAVQQSLDADSVIVALLSQAREMFHADRAEILLFPTGIHPAVISTSAADAPTELMRPVHLDPTQGVWARVAAEGRGVCLPRPIRGQRLREYFEERGMRDVMVAPLQGRDGIIGTMLVANRHGSVNTFNVEELRLFETLANHASVSLENGRLVDTLRMQAAENEYQARHDALTGLPNRRFFRLRVQEAVESGGAAQAPLAVIVMDLDRFKEVNDTLGHDQGDRLLQQISGRLTALAGDSNTVARLSGDEFAALLPGASEPEAITLAEALLAALREPFVLQEMQIEVGGSVGIALYPQHATNADTLIQRADVAMYLAKSSHAGYELYAADRDQSSPARLALVADLRRGIDEHELTVLYQPQAELATGRIVAAEALVRWQHPRHGMMLPDQFIPIAEQAGLLRPLTLYVLEAAISQCSAWRKAGADVGVAVNLSVRNLLDLELPDDIARILDRWAVPASALELEITESTIMADLPRTYRVLTQLHDLGAGIAIDDFGTGYSSLAQLKRLLVDELKIDKSFVINMAADDNDRLIVRSTIELGKNLGLRVVAEGIETGAVWEELRALGCDRAQGHYLSRPITGAQLTRRLLEASTMLAADGRSEPPGGARLERRDPSSPLRLVKTG